MTEKEKTLDLVVKHFVEKGWKAGRSKDQFEMVNANQWHAAALETVRLGAALDTIHWTVREYLGRSKSRFFGSDNFHRAVYMALEGASKEVTEDVLAVAVKYYSWIWPVEKLTAYLGRKPTEEEIFSLIEVERKDLAVFSEKHHKELVQFAKKYLPSGKVEKIEGILEAKTTEFNSHSD